MKRIELPRIVTVGDDAIYDIRTIVDNLDLKGKSLIICDPTTAKIAGEEIRKQLCDEIYILKDNQKDDFSEELAHIEQSRVSFLVGVGGGKVIDRTKVLAFDAKIPYLSIPTAASHDGISSPRASIVRDGKSSLGVESPLGVIADTKIIRRAPKRLLASGAADVISNYTAILDWRLAQKENHEYFGDYSAALSMMSARIVMKNASKVQREVSILVEALVSSGVAMGIAGSSRPCSGSEHNFSHALEKIAKKPALHGEQCGVGSIMSAYLHHAGWEKVRDALKAVKAPTNAKELGVTDEEIIEALATAHKIRKRYTIFRGGLTRIQAEELAKATEVI
ncbi:MAG: NAD(P)-dependent glycerol-1-phosphate dehydrogenase [Candidatus Altiarchaeota archaeon]